ncbi:hypothetical protein GEMRC1_008717 [Eukaryota sp. GEM-RC1]
MGTSLLLFYCLFLTSLQLSSTKQQFHRFQLNNQVYLLPEYFDTLLDPAPLDLRPVLKQLLPFFNQPSSCCSLVVSLIPGAFPDHLESFLKSYNPTYQDSNSVSFSLCSETSSLTHILSLLSLFASEPTVHSINILPSRAIPHLCYARHSFMNGSHSSTFCTQKVSYPFTGKGEIVTVSDSGIDPHHVMFLDDDGQSFSDFDLQEGKVSNHSKIARYDTVSGSRHDHDGHGSHVSAIINGSPVSGSNHQGIAHNARIAMIDLCGSDCSTLSIPSRPASMYTSSFLIGSRIFSNSWGLSSLGIYDSLAQSVDQFIYQNDDVIMISSAGNSGNAGLRTISSPSSSKNSLSIGSSFSGRWSAESGCCHYNGQPGCCSRHDTITKASRIFHLDNVPAFSSRGPSDDSRIKPDLIVPGDPIVSCDANSGNRLFSMSGTSMSAPLISAGAALIREGLRDIRPSGYLIKGLIVLSCRASEGDVWWGSWFVSSITRDVQGFGRSILSRVLPTSGIQETLNSFRSVSGEFIWFADRQVLTNSKNEVEYVLNIRNSNVATVVLTWYDVPGDLSKRKSLENNLNLFVISDRYRWLFGNDFLNSTRFFDNFNTVESANLSLVHDNHLRVLVSSPFLPSGTQRFSLAVISDGEVELLDDVTPFSCANYESLAYCRSKSCPGDCSGNGKCVFGQCVCDDLWTGFDCSMKHCNGIEVFTSASGQFESQIGMSRYNPNSDCVFLIEPSNRASEITINFDHLDLENVHDVVLFSSKIDLVFSSSDYEQSVSGSLETSTSSFVSRTGLVVVRFLSDADVEKSGFKISYFSKYSSCSGITRLSQSSGSFSSNHFASRYPPNSLCVFYIEPDTEPKQSILIDFSRFETEKDFDVLSIYNIDDVLIANYSGDLDPFSVQVPGTGAILIFSSDESLEFSGFSASYSLIDYCGFDCFNRGQCRSNQECDCDDGYSGSVCNIDPQSYCSSLSCSDCITSASCGICLTDLGEFHCTHGLYCVYPDVLLDNYHCEFFEGLKSLKVYGDVMLGSIIGQNRKVVQTELLNLFPDPDVIDSVILSQSKFLIKISNFSLSQSIDKFVYLNSDLSFALPRSIYADKLDIFWSEYPLESVFDEDSHQSKMIGNHFLPIYFDPSFTSISESGNPLIYSFDHVISTLDFDLLYNFGFSFVKLFNNLNHSLDLDFMVLQSLPEFYLPTRITLLRNFHSFLVSTVDFEPSKSIIFDWRVQNDTSNSIPHFKSSFLPVSESWFNHQTSLLFEFSAYLENHQQFSTNLIIVYASTTSTTHISPNYFKISRPPIFNSIFLPFQSSICTSSKKFITNLDLRSKPFEQRVNSSTSHCYLTRSSFTIINQSFLIEADGVCYDYDWYHNVISSVNISIVPLSLTSFKLVVQKPVLTRVFFELELEMGSKLVRFPLNSPSIDDTFDFCWGLPPNSKLYAIFHDFHGFHSKLSVTLSPSFFTSTFTVDSLNCTMSEVSSAMSFIFNLLVSHSLDFNSSFDF